MYTLGIDIGSTTSKCAVLKDGKELVAHSLQTGGLGTGGPEEALAQLWQTSGLTRADMACAFVTGYGRKNYQGADGEISELTAHALGGRFVFPDLRTVIDIGGQDAKVIALSPSGKMVNFVMNDKCAAGTGRFLDVMASILRLDVDDLDAEAAKAAALKHAGLSEGQVQELQVEWDSEHGRAVYEVEFKSGGMEYEYVIDAATGAVLDHETERDD